MIKDLDKVLEYQNIDIKLRRTLDALEKCDDAKRMEVAKTEFNGAKETVDKVEKKAEEIVKEYKGAKQNLEELDKKLSDMELIIANAESEEDLGNVLAELQELKFKAIACEKAFSEYKTDSEELIKNYQSANSTGFRMREAYQKAKEGYLKLKKEKEQEINKYKFQLKELEPQIDPETMSKYKAIVADRKYPAITDVYVGEGNAYSCKGCGLQLSQKNISVLNEEGSCVCETCRRLIYKK